MIDVKDLRSGNAIYRIFNHHRQEVIALAIDEDKINHISNVNFEPIPLTPDLLLKCGANKSSIDNPFFSHYDFHFSRDRHISVSNPNTPNEMIMLLEENKEGKVPSVICIRNYDYDGKTYFHQLQNIFYLLSNTELIYSPN